MSAERKLTVGAIGDKEGENEARKERKKEEKSSRVRGSTTPH